MLMMHQQETPSSSCYSVDDDAVASSTCLLSLSTAIWLVSVACITVSLLGWTKTRVLVRIGTLMVNYTFMRFFQHISDAWTQGLVLARLRQPRAAWVYPYPLPDASTATTAAPITAAPRPVMKRPRPAEVVPSAPAPLVEDSKKVATN